MFNLNSQRIVLLVAAIVSLSAQARLNPSHICIRVPGISSEVVCQNPVPEKTEVVQAKELLPGFEAAIIEKENEGKVEYHKIFQDPKSTTTLEAKEFKVEISSTNVVSLALQSTYRILEITVTDRDNGKVIAYQRQYSDSVDNLNAMVMNFVHPRTLESYVVGVRSETCTKRLAKKK